MNFDRLNLYYDISIEGGCGFRYKYNVYFNGDVIEKKYQEIINAVRDFFQPCGKQGHIEVSRMADNVEIYLDVCLMELEEGDASVDDVLLVLNGISGIRLVVVNGSTYGFLDKEEYYETFTVLY